MLCADGEKFFQRDTRQYLNFYFHFLPSTILSFHFQNAHKSLTKYIIHHFINPTSTIKTNWFCSTNFVTSFFDRTIHSNITIQPCKNRAILSATGAVSTLVADNKPRCSAIYSNASSTSNPSTSKLPWTVYLMNVFQNAR